MSEQATGLADLIKTFRLSKSTVVLPLSIPEQLADESDLVELAEVILADLREFFFTGLDVVEDA